LLSITIGRDQFFQASARQQVLAIALFGAKDQHQSGRPMTDLEYSWLRR
jgi:hypothetical protein